MNNASTVVSGTFQLQNELSDYVSEKELQTVMSRVNSICDKINSAIGKTFLPLFEVVRNSKMITILLMDELKVIHTEIELTAANDAYGTIYKLANSDWSLVKNTTHKDITANRVCCELKKLEPFFSPKSISAVRVHVKPVSREKCKSPYAYDLKTTESELILTKKWKGSDIMSIQIFKINDKVSYGE